MKGNHYNYGVAHGTEYLWNKYGVGTIRDTDTETYTNSLVPETLTESPSTINVNSEIGRLFPREGILIVPN